MLVIQWRVWGGVLFASQSNGTNEERGRCEAGCRAMGWETTRLHDAYGRVAWRCNSTARYRGMAGWEGGKASDSRPTSKARQASMCLCMYLYAEGEGPSHGCVAVGRGTIGRLDELLSWVALVGGATTARSTMGESSSSPVQGGWWENGRMGS